MYFLYWQRVAVGFWCYAEQWWSSNRGNEENTQQSVQLFTIAQRHLICECLKEYSGEGSREREDRGNELKPVSFFQILQIRKVVALNTHNF